MMAKLSWRLVIDASVTRSASPGLKTDLQAGSYAALNQALEICHRIVFSDALREEWHRHRSRYSASWLRSMYAKKKVVALPEAAPDLSFRQSLLESATRPKDRAALEKDLLLVEAALATDSIIISRDDVMRELLRSAAAQVPRLRGLVWANPAKDADFIDWLWGRTGPTAEMVLDASK